jgi:hypothetical protein
MLEVPFAEPSSSFWHSWFVPTQNLGSDFGRWLGCASQSVKGARRGVKAAETSPKFTHVRIAI